MSIFSLTRQPVQPEQGILRQDLNVISPGHAVIRKVIAGSNIEISYTGIDAGTGDVTISYVPSSSSPNPNVVLFNNTGSGNSSGASYNGSQSITVSYNTIGAQGQSPILTALTNLVYSGGTPFVKMTGANTFALDTTIYLTANQNITLSGDVTGSGNVAISTTISNNAVTLSKLAQISTSRFLGRWSPSTGNVEALTSTEATSLLNLFTNTLQGLVPASGGGTINFLRADGTWAAPAGGGGGSSGTTTNSITFNNSGSGNTSGITFNGSSAVTVSFNTIGAQQSNAILTGLTSLTYVSGTPFVKMTGASSFSLDTNTYYLASNPSGYTNNTGTVTSVALSLPAIFGLTGSPITTSGTFTVTLASQTANTVFIAPNGSAGAPTFRALVLADLPSLSTTNVSEGTNLYYTDTRARAALSFVAGSGAYNSTTGVITIPTNTSQLTNGAGFITGNQNITLSGDATGSGATSIAVTLANSGVTAGTYTKVTVDVKGRVTVGALLASGDLPTYTGTLTSSQVTTALGYTPYNSTNPNGYITGYTETDTLASVTGRGASTSTNLTFNGTLSFGSVTRQMLNLWSTDYALGVQSSTLYFRSGSRFSWFRGGSHNDSENNPGGGTVAMTLDGSSNLTVGNAITAGGIVYLTYNTASGRTNMGFSTGNSVLGNIHIQNGSGPGNDNSNQAAITFQGSSSSQAQAGIYVLNNGSYGTSMGFAVTENYTTGPQLFMTSTNGGLVNFPRATPTVAGNPILHAGNFSSYAVPARINSNWADNTVINNVIGLLAWKTYGNNHVIFDGSSATSPSGSAISNTNSANAWTSSYPILMGWNGTQTYGVRVDSARVADVLANMNISQFTNNSGYITSAANWFGAVTTGGTLDWNDVTNTRPGTGFTLLLGNATNGFGVGTYYHAFNLEYSSKDGTGNVTQLAIAYAGGNDIKMRGRFSGSWSGWITFLSSSNYNSYSPTLTGGGASGTWGISISGNAATVSDGMYLSPTQTVSGIKYFISNLGSTLGSLSSPPLQAYATGSNSAFMSFHRQGNYAVNFGLDSDNVLRIGGWSASANRWELDMSGNNTIAGSFNALNGSVVSGSYGTNAHASSSPRVVGRIFAPRGAAYSDIPISGAIKIRLPIRANDSMWTMKVRIYNYAQNQTSEYLLGNYSYSAGAYNWSATYLGGSASIPYNVRFGNDGTYDCVWIGETSTSWSYPVISVIDFTSGYANGSVNNYLTNWDISIVTSFGTVGAVVSPNINFYEVSAFSYRGNSNVGGTGSASWHPDGIYCGSTMWQYGGQYKNNTGIYNLLDLQLNNGFTISQVASTAYAQFNNWVYLPGAHGFYSAVNSAHIYPNNITSFGQWIISGSRNSYGGIYDSFSAVNGFMYDSAGNGGIYREASTRWYLYYNLTNDCLGVGTSSTNSTYSLYLNKGVYAQARIDAPIFYDSQDNAYYVDPNNLSVLQNLYLLGGIGGISNSSSYTEAALEIRERGFGGAQDDTWATSPRLSFHWSGRVASQIGLASNGRVHIRNNPGTANEDFQAAAIYGTIFYDSTNSAYYFDGNATGDSIRVAGDIVAYYSDERLKDIKQNIPNALSKLLSLNGFYYEPNKIAQSYGYEKKLQVGLSAQQVEAVLPEVIKDAPIGNGYKTLDYSKLVPLLVEAIKEQQTQIEHLKSKLDGITN